MPNWIKGLWYAIAHHDHNGGPKFAPVLDNTSVAILGNFAADALKNPAIETALKKVEADLVHAWETSSPKDAEAREHLYFTIQGLALFKSKLQGMIVNAQYEAEKTKQNSASSDKESAQRSPV